MTCSSSPGPTEISPANGWSCAAIINTDAATPVANNPTVMAEAIRLSQWTMAIANNEAAACTNRQSHLTKLTCDWQADLVHNLHDAVIASTGGSRSALAAKAATKTIPIVFTHGSDPVRAGIVASLNRPDENITGVTWFGGDVAGKRLALLHDIVPNISTIGFLTNPGGDLDEQSSQRADVQDVARRFDLKLVVMNASTEREIDAAFATFAQQQVGAVVVASDPFLVNRREPLLRLAP